MKNNKEQDVQIVETKNEPNNSKRNIIIAIIVALLLIFGGVMLFSSKDSDKDDEFNIDHIADIKDHSIQNSDKFDEGKPEIDFNNQGSGTDVNTPDNNNQDNQGGDNQTSNNNQGGDQPVVNENPGNDKPNSGNTSSDSTGNSTSGNTTTGNSTSGNTSAGNSGTGNSTAGNAGNPSTGNQSSTAPTKAPAATATVAPSKPTATPTKAPSNSGTTVKPSVESGTPVSNHGKLSVSGTKIVDKAGKPYQLKGVSTHGIAWFPDYVNKDAFKNLRDDFGANAVRLAMYTHEYGGYCESTGNKENLKRLVNNGVQYATELGMYVIIDWHTLNGVSNNPANTINDAKVFWNEMSKKYASYDNVIYEICNEPNSGTSWAQVKSYAETIIKIIRANDADAIILVGTPTWSQDVDKVAQDPIKGQKNIMYNLHFYAGTHKQWLRDKMVTALNKGLPIFVSEFGITDATGNGACDINEANAWIAALNKYNISYMCWNLSNKDESSAIIKSNVSKKSGWTYDDLKTEGQWLVKTLGGRLAGGTAAKPTATPTPTKAPAAQPTKAPVATATPTKAPATQPTKAPAATATPTKAPATSKPSAINFKQGSISATSAEPWSENGMDGYTIQFNMGGQNVAGKTIVITFTGNVKIKQASDVWGGKATVSGNTVTITNTEAWFGGMNILVNSGATIKSITVK